MNKIYGMISLVVMIGIICFIANGDIYGSYPGLDKLIERSEAIGLVEIIDPPPDPNTPYDPTNGTISGIYQKKQIRNRYSITGDFPKNHKMDMSICYLRKSGIGTFRDGNVFLAFMRRGNGDFWETINCEGSVLKVSPLICSDSILNTTDETHDAKKIINQILKRSMELEKQELKDMDDDYSLVLSK